MNQIKNKKKLYTVLSIFILLSINFNSFAQPTIKNFPVVVASTSPLRTFPNPTPDDSIVICAGDSLNYTITNYTDPAAYCQNMKVFTETYTIDQYPLNSATPTQLAQINRGMSGVFLTPCNQGFTLNTIPNITTSFYIATHISLYVSTPDVSPNYYRVTKVIVSPSPIEPKVINVLPQPATPPGSNLTSIQIVDTDPNTDYVWYKENPSVNILFTGNPFSPGPLSTDTNFYVVSKQKAGVGLGGQCGSSFKKVHVFVRGALFIPNVFAPNGKELANRRFQVKGEIIDKGTMLIYNQWGQLVFQTANVTNGWDGMVSGKLQPTGVYVYVVTGTYVNGQKFTQKGSVTLIR